MGKALEKRCYYCIDNIDYEVKIVAIHICTYIHNITPVLPKRVEHMKRFIYNFYFYILAILN